jgi:hypothetical protein
MVEKDSRVEIDPSQYGDAMIRIYGPKPVAINLNILGIPEQVQKKIGESAGGSFLARVEAFEYSGKFIRLDTLVLIIVPGGGEPSNDHGELAGKDYLMWELPQSMLSSRLEIQSGTLRELLMTLTELERLSTVPMTLIKIEDEIFSIPVDLAKHLITNPEIRELYPDESKAWSEASVAKLAQPLSANVAQLIARSNAGAPRMIRAAMTPVARIDDRFDVS